MFETTKLSPVYNGYQYLVICIVAIIIDMIVHFFSTRKYYALKLAASQGSSGTDTFGFAPALAPYYRSLCRKGPFPIDGDPESFYSYCNSWLIGAVIAGCVAVVLLLITDLILQAVEYKNSS